MTQSPQSAVRELLSNFIASDGLRWKVSPSFMCAWDNAALCVASVERQDIATDGPIVMRPPSPRTIGGVPAEISVDITDGDGVLMIGDKEVGRLSFPIPQGYVRS